MNTQSLLHSSLLLLLFYPLHAETSMRRATITGGRGPANCRIEISVDHTAELEILGDTGNLTTLAGQAAYWRSFQCNAPLPSMPNDFRLSRIDGRGQVHLVKDPRRNRGAAVIHISDPKGGRATYSIDIAWRGAENGWGSMPPSPPAGPGTGGAIRDAIRVCQESVIARLNRDGYQYVTFGRTIPDNNPGPNDWISGFASGRRGGEMRNFSFSCSVDFRSGTVRFVDVRRR